MTSLKLQLLSVLVFQYNIYYNCLYNKLTYYEWQKIIYSLIWIYDLEIGHQPEQERMCMKWNNALEMNITHIWY